MTKKLKFAEDLIPRILSGEKTSTWRINDDKDLKVGDKLDLLSQVSSKKFAEAKITHVIEKKMENLTEEDKKGHEAFTSDKEMYDTYSKYYQIEVTPNTTIKIIRFSLI